MLYRDEISLLYVHIFRFCMSGVYCGRPWCVLSRGQELFFVPPY